MKFDHINIASTACEKDLGLGAEQLTSKARWCHLTFLRVCPYKVRLGALYEYEDIMKNEFCSSKGRLEQLSTPPLARQRRSVWVKGTKSSTVPQTQFMLESLWAFAAQKTQLAAQTEGLLPSAVCMGGSWSQGPFSELQASSPPLLELGLFLRLPRSWACRIRAEEKMGV